MRRMVLLLGLALGSIVWWVAASRDARELSPALSVEPEAVGEPSRSDLVPPEPVAEPERHSRASEEASAHRDAGKSGASKASSAEASRVLRGLLTEGEGGPPLPGVRLEVYRATVSREVLTRVVTDAEGRFETQPLPCVELSLRHLPDLEDPEHALALWILPAAITLPPSEAGEPAERWFWAQPPKEIVLVEVFGMDGLPAPGALARLTFVALNPETGQRIATGGAATTSSRGRALIGLWDSDGFERGTLFARDAGEGVSEVLVLDGSNYRGPHRLRLGPPCTLVVRLSGPDPLLGRVVRIRGPRDIARPGEPERTLGLTGLTGSCTFTGLYPSEYVAEVENPSTGGVSRGAITLWPGGTAELVIELERGKQELASWGSVLDEGGLPLAGIEVVFRADRGWAESATTDAEGRFECWAAPCDSIEVALDRDPHGDCFAPDAVTAACGTGPLVFRRTERAVAHRFQVRATDRVSGAAIEPLHLTFDRGVGSEEWSDSYGPRETYIVEASAATRCKVAAHGYIGTSFPLLATLASAGGDPPRIELTLGRGLSHAIRVLDVDSLTPLADATFTTPNLPVLRTDADGWAQLSAAEWSVYTVERQGYQSETWDPDEALLFDLGPLHLSPIE